MITEIKDMTNQTIKNGLYNGITGYKSLFFYYNGNIKEIKLDNIKFSYYPIKIQIYKDKLFIYYPK